MLLEQGSWTGRSQASPVLSFCDSGVADCRTWQMSFAACSRALSFSLLGSRVPLLGGLNELAFSLVAVYLSHNFSCQARYSSSPFSVSCEHTHLEYIPEMLVCYLLVCSTSEAAAPLCSSLSTSLITAVTWQCNLFPCQRGILFPKSSLQPLTTIVVIVLVMPCACHVIQMDLQYLQDSVKVGRAHVGPG